MRSKNGRSQEIPPTHCPLGHLIRPGLVQVAYAPCSCTPGAGGHRTYLCRTLIDGIECGAKLEIPPCTDHNQRASRYPGPLSS